ncbi:hypothetical protein BLNAU_24402 [Blattamonas nauphoetae]|uniref:Uncharacterized protein n=1 Tax=Blattamonas nauphoetae TaxID=2049346 RepID=A0ABQ9WMJ0_9EUKA|nr:hypothetical protein BLNAU_24402 [Blattamonas nauphoetae]
MYESSRDRDTIDHQFVFTRTLFSSENGELLEEAEELATKRNIECPATFGIKQVARICSDRPSGTTSALLATTSGIHAAHDPSHLPRVMMETDSPLSTSFLILIHIKQAPSSCPNFHNVSLTVNYKLGDEEEYPVTDNIGIA